MAPRFKVNRGGEIDSNEIIGREQDLDILLRTLEQQSVLVAAERRIGKTTLCRQAQRRLSNTSLAIYQDIENVNSTGELASVLVKIATPHLSRSKQWQQRSGALYRRLAGMAVSLPDAIGGGGFTLPPALQPQWKELIQDTIADLITTQTEGANPMRHVCLLLDEFPIALENISAIDPRAAMEVLNLFRDLRGTYGSALRFVFTGSIGIHHVIRRLHSQGYPNAPMNDVFPLHVKALSIEDARTLALGLLFGETVRSSDYEPAAERIADRSCCVPFYIHHVVGALRDEGIEANAQNIDRVIEDSITAPLDPWQFRNYRIRLDRHFHDLCPIAVALLDALSISAEPCDFPALCDRVRLQIVDCEEDAIGDTLDLLEQDFYIERDSQEQKYRFLRPLLARAWRHIQRLPSPKAHG